MQEKINNAVREFYADMMDKKTERWARFLWWDLYYGPLNGCDDCGADSLHDCTCENRYPGFSDATQHVSAWCDNHLEPMVYSVQCECVCTGNAEAIWAEAHAECHDDCDGGCVDMSDFIDMDVRDVKKALFGHVSDYV